MFIGYSKVLEGSPYIGTQSASHAMTFAVAIVPGILISAQLVTLARRRPSVTSSPCAPLTILIVGGVIRGSCRMRSCVCVCACNRVVLVLQRGGTGYMGTGFSAHGARTFHLSFIQNRPRRTLCFRRAYRKHFAHSLVGRLCKSRLRKSRENRRTPARCKYPRA